MPVVLRKKVGPQEELRSEIRARARNECDEIDSTFRVGRVFLNARLERPS
jgi:hypothetical protein